MPSPIPKPPKRKTEKRKRRQADGRWVSQVRDLVVVRDGQRCRVCSKDRWKFGRWLHMHEIVYRSKTLGRPMKDRVNTKNCILICDECHRDIHASRLWVVIMNKSKGADGPLLFTKERPND